jgi:polyisoprenoid-binding protein YceI
VRLPTFGPETAVCEVLTFREGFLSAMAHDLLLRVGAFELVVDPAAPLVSARIDAGSLRVVTALRDGRPLPGALRPADVREIEATIAGTVLRASRFPEIRFTSTAVSRVGDGYDVRGALVLCGATGELSIPIRREGERLRADVTVHQPDFGIRPYAAMLGTLRVRPDVIVRVSVPAEGF